MGRISKFEADKLEGDKCGGGTLYKDPKAFWKESGEEATDCHKECKSCLAEGIVNGPGTVECEVGRGALESSRRWGGIEEGAYEISESS